MRYETSCSEATQQSESGAGSDSLMQTLRYSGLQGDGDFNHNPYSKHTTQLIFVPFPGGLPPGCHHG